MRGWESGEEWRRRKRGSKSKGGKGQEVEGGIWPTQKLWRGAPYVRHNLSLSYLYAPVNPIQFNQIVIVK